MRASPLTPLLLVLTACFGSDNTLSVGIAVSAGWERAIQLAREDFPDLPVTLLWDSAVAGTAKASAAIEYANWLVEREVEVVIGHTSSRPTVAGAGVYNRYGVLQIAPIATSSQLEQQGPWSYALVPNGETEGRLLASFADSVLAVSRAAVIISNDEFGLDIRDGAVAEFRRRGIAVVDERLMPPQGVMADPEAAARIAAAVLQADPDVLLVAVQQSEVAVMMDVVRRAGAGVNLLSSDGTLVLPEGEREAKLQALEGVYAVRFWHASRDSASAAFARRFFDRFGEMPDQAEALTYGAFHLVARATRAGARDAEAVRRFLSELGDRSAPPEEVMGPHRFAGGRPVDGSMEIVCLEGAPLISSAEIEMP